jgi:hypothetical protein
MRKELRPGKGSHTQERVVLQKDFSVAREAEHIIGKALEQDGRLVILCPIALFSTTTGDAWMLDMDDRLALCLARQGEVLPYQITESESDFHIQWDARYTIEGDVFIVADGLGSVKKITGYPVQDILRAERRTRATR